MAAGTRNVRIFVSEQCFDLLVDAMAAFSKETRRFQTMRMTVQAACSRLKSHGISKVLNSTSSSPSTHRKGHPDLSRGHA
jgi:hypothetical protein